MIGLVVRSAHLRLRPSLRPPFVIPVLDTGIHAAKASLSSGLQACLARATAPKAQAIAQSSSFHVFDDAIAMTVADLNCSIDRATDNWRVEIVAIEATS